MSARTTVLLAALILLFGSYLWWEERGGPPDAVPATAGRGGPGAAPPPAARGFFDFDPAQVTRVRLQHDGSTREAHRSAAGWPTPAIGEFLRSLTQLGVIVDLSQDAGQPAEYGLHPPRSEATVYLAGMAQPLVLRIGNRNPPSTGVYVQVGVDGPMGLAGALVDWEFEKAFKGLGAPVSAAAQ